MFPSPLSFPLATDIPVLSLCCLPGHPVKESGCGFLRNPLDLLESWGANSRWEGWVARQEVHSWVYLPEWILVTRHEATFLSWLGAAPLKPCIKGGCWMLFVHIMSLMPSYSFQVLAPHFFPVRHCFGGWRALMDLGSLQNNSRLATGRMKGPLLPMKSTFSFTVSYSTWLCYKGIILRASGRRVIASFLTISESIEVSIFYSIFWGQLLSSLFSSSSFCTL